MLKLVNSRGEETTLSQSFEKIPDKNWVSCNFVVVQKNKDWYMSIVGLPRSDDFVLMDLREKLGTTFAAKGIYHRDAQKIRLFDNEVCLPPAEAKKLLEELEILLLSG